MASAILFLFILLGKELTKKEVSCKLKGKRRKPVREKGKAV